MKRISIVLLAVIICSCNSTGNLTKRYKSINIEASQKINDYVDVSAFVSDPEKIVAADPSPKIFSDLAPQAQKELIRQIGFKVKGSESLIYFLGKELYKPKDDKYQPKVIDNTVFKKRFIISLKNKSDYPADRISKVEITFERMDANIEVVSCDKNYIQLSNT